MKTLDEMHADDIRSRGTDAFWLGYAIATIRGARERALHGEPVLGYLTDALHQLTVEREIARQRAAAEVER